MCKNLKLFCPEHGDYYDQEFATCDDYVTTGECISTRTNKVPNKKRTTVCNACSGRNMRPPSIISVEEVETANPTPNTNAKKSKHGRRSTQQPIYEDIDEDINTTSSARLSRTNTASTSATGYTTASQSPRRYRTASISAEKYEKVPKAARTMWSMMGLMKPDTRSNKHRLMFKMN